MERGRLAILLTVPLLAGCASVTHEQAAVISRAAETCPGWFKAFGGTLSDYRAGMQPDGEWRVWKSRWYPDFYLYFDKEHPLAECHQVLTSRER